MPRPFYYEDMLRSRKGGTKFSGDYTLFERKSLPDVSIIMKGGDGYFVLYFNL